MNLTFYWRGSRTVRPAPLTAGDGVAGGKEGEGRKPWGHGRGPPKGLEARSSGSTRHSLISRFLEVTLWLAGNVAINFLQRGSNPKAVSRQ